MRSFPPCSKQLRKISYALKNIIFNGLYCLITPDQIFKNLFLISAVHPLPLFSASGILSSRCIYCLLVCAAPFPDSCFLILLQDPVCRLVQSIRIIVIRRYLRFLCQTFFMEFFSISGSYQNRENAVILAAWYPEAYLLSYKNGLCPLQTAPLPVKTSQSPVSCISSSFCSLQCREPMVGTVVKAVDFCSKISQKSVHILMKSFYVLLPVVASGHSGLIGDYHQLKACLLKPCQGLGTPGKRRISSGR